MGAVVSRLTQFAGGRAPSTTLIVNEYSSGNASKNNLTTGTQGVLATSGAGTGGSLGTVLSVTGAGYVTYLVAFSNSATPTHTIRCKVIVDGVTVFDATSDTITTTAGRGMTVVDTIPSDPTYADPSGLPIRFNSSFVVQIASSVSGTDYAGIRYEYHKTAY
jgi:hypothetical protein